VDYDIKKWKGVHLNYLVGWYRCVCA